MMKDILCGNNKMTFCFDLVWRFLTGDAVKEQLSESVDWRLHSEVRVYIRMCSLVVRPSFLVFL